MSSEQVQVLEPSGDPFPFEATPMPRGEPGFMLVLQPPLVPEGTYRVRYGSQCEGPETFESAFTVGPSRSMPGSLGTLVVRQSAWWSEVPVANDGLCATRIPAAYARLKLELAPEIVPYLPLLKWTLSVDGQPWAGEAYGSLMADGKLKPGGGAVLPRRVLLVHAACDAFVLPGSDRGLALGAHEAQLTGTLASIGSLPLVSTNVSFVLSCAGSPEAPSPFEAGAATPPDEPPTDAGEDSGAADSRDAPSTCAAAPGLTALLALLAAAPFTRRRRRAVAPASAPNPAARRE